MYSKFSPHATLALGLLFVACASASGPGEPAAREVNLAFVLRDNLPVVSSATINGVPGRFLIGCSEHQTILDERFARAVGGPPWTLQLGERESLPFTPLVADLRGVADAILGADLWGSRAITIDYHEGLLTYQPEGIHPGLMTLYHYRGEPAIDIVVGGKTIQAVVDTTSPDTLVLPRDGGAEGRREVRVEIAGTDFGMVDALWGDVHEARIGNRLLSRFLITLDYGKREIGLWRDPRIP